MENFDVDGDYKILDSNNYIIKTGSGIDAPIRTHREYSQLATVFTQSQTYFTGSIRPAGNLFSIY